ncbi:MAG: UbiA family prenyltransferase [Verrucomicrobiae bacterium]|nr:UbiA family prenyltransferase [Verrucomicrobiae bacterium]
MLRTILILGRVSNLPTVWTNVLAGWFLAGGSWSMGLLWTAVGVSLLYIAGMTLNDAFDADWDRRHAPERPIPSGSISSNSVWILGLSEMLAGTVVLWLGAGASAGWVTALIGAILLYDLIHKKTPLAVLVMGACRAGVYVVTASAVRGSGQLSDLPTVFWVLLAAVWAFVAGITVTARSERTDAAAATGVLGGLLLHAPIFVLAVAPAQMAEGTERAIWFFAVTTVAVAWLEWSEITMRRSKPRAVGMLIAAMTLIDGAAVIYLDAVAGLVCASLLPVTWLLQRRIPAT